MDITGVMNVLTREGNKKGCVWYVPERSLKKNWWPFPAFQYPFVCFLGRPQNEFIISIGINTTTAVPASPKKKATVSVTIKSYFEVLPY